MLQSTFKELDLSSISTAIILPEITLIAVITTLNKRVYSYSPCQKLA